MRKKSRIFGINAQGIKTTVYFNKEVIKTAAEPGQRERRHNHTHKKSVFQTLKALKAAGENPTPEGEAAPDTGGSNQERKKAHEKKVIILKSLDIDPCYAFIFSDEEIEAAERKEEERAAEIESVFFAPGFIAAEYRHESGAREILHRSTRNGVFFQLSYIAADGVPTMHENYIKVDHPNPVKQAIETKAALLRHFVRLDADIALKVLTA